ncbi:alpha/beta hydrolase family esterase [Dietzia psychralcaliphila]|nr:alpha/beta fold hydrolase [Dietzia psychralcaliphila]
MTESRSPRTVGAAVLVALAMVMSACTAQSGDPAPPGAMPGDGTQGLSSDSTTLDDLTRTWTVYRPPAAVDPSAPVLLVIHGTGDTGSGIRNGIGPDLEQLADEEGFSIVYVDGHANNWNECRREGDWPAKEEDLDDVGLMREAVDSLGATGPVYAVGFSSGGHMAMRLALEAPDLVDGVAAVAANPPTPENLNCAVGGDPVPIMFVQGRQDTINPIDGGEVSVGSGPFAKSRGDVLSAVDGAEWFARHNGVAGDGAIPPIDRDGDAEVITWDGPDPVRVVMVDRVGHSFPTLSGRWGRDGGARYDAPGEIWRFFSRGSP